MIYEIPEAIFLYDEGIKKFDGSTTFTINPERSRRIGFPAIKKFINENFGSIAVRLIKLKKQAVETEGLLFDFLNSYNSFESAKKQKPSKSCHIILTDKLFATFDEQKKPHIRAAIFGVPSVVSIPGIVEGPARPKDYYLYKQKYQRLGIWEIEGQKVRQKFRGRFIDYGDKRITEVIKGLVSQALFFYITGEPFCKLRNCRLFNAHWQEDLIYAQIKSNKFCSRHKKILTSVIARTMKQSEAIS